jgi:hypothetical protein
MCYFLLEGHTEEHYKLVLEVKIELHLFQQYFTSPTRPLKQEESKTTLGPDTSPAHASYAQQFLSVKVSNRAAQFQTSRDLLWPASTNKFHVPCLIPIQTQTV